eukprot:scaffold22977_cov84-Skeletonema_marinoi.AAC.1
MEKWRKDMNEAIDSINQILPDTPAGYEDYNDDDVGEKAFAIREWITNVLQKFAHYQKQHRRLVKEAMTTVELAMWKKSLNERDNNVRERVEEGGRAKRRIKRGADGAKAKGPTASSAAAAAAVTSVTSAETTAAAGEKRKASSETTESVPARAECRIKCGADIVIKNVLPFLELPPNARRGITTKRSDYDGSTAAGSSMGGNNSQQSAESLISKELFEICISESLSKEGLHEIIEQHDLTPNKNPHA